MKIIGKRKSRKLGVPAEPDEETQQWFKDMGNYRIKVPARIIRYRSHEEANADRETWKVIRIVETKENQEKENS